MVTEFQVEGMTCEGCAGAVRRALENLLGVHRVEVDLAGKRVSVTYNEDDTDETAIKVRIEGAGFDVVGSQPGK